MSTIIQETFTFNTFLHTNHGFYLEINLIRDALKNKKRNPYIISKGIDIHIKNTFEYLKQLLWVLLQSLKTGRNRVKFNRRRYIKTFIISHTKTKQNFTVFPINILWTFTNNSYSCKILDLHLNTHNIHRKFYNFFRPIQFTKLRILKYDIKGDSFLNFRIKHQLCFAIKIGFVLIKNYILLREPLYISIHLKQIQPKDFNIEKKYEELFLKVQMDFLTGILITAILIFLFKKPHELLIHFSPPLNESK